MCMKKEKPDWIFQCRKCNHQVYIEKNRLKKLAKKDCPECGEESGGLWIFVGEGDFDKDNLPT